MNETNLKAEDLLSDAEAGLTAIQGTPVRHYILYDVTSLQVDIEGI